MQPVSPEAGFFITTKFHNYSCISNKRYNLQIMFHLLTIFRKISKFAKEDKKLNIIK